MKYPMRTILATLVLPLALSACVREARPWEGLLYPKTGQMPYGIVTPH
jgi:hypothetical protein